jgi:cytochrome c-type biogenesis protein CcmH/NrfG
MAALQQKNLPLATKCLGEAALLMPKQARYRALYGRALAFSRETRRQAESELQAAIALDAQNASFRVILAELYQEIGLKRRAEGELERALAIDPGNEQARRLLDALHSAT